MPKKTIDSDAHEVVLNRIKALDLEIDKLCHKVDVLRDERNALVYAVRHGYAVVGIDKEVFSPKYKHTDDSELQ